MDGQFSNNGSAQKEGAGFGVASMVLGILALLFSCCFIYISLPCALIAIILGAVGIKKNSGKGMAIAGLICGIISLIPSIIILVVGGGIFAAMQSELMNSAMMILL